MKITRECPACGSKDVLWHPAVLMPFVAIRAFGWHPWTIKEEDGLRDVLPGRAYTVCNTEQCTKCLMIYCDIRPDPDEMKRLYAGYRGPDYNAMRTRLEPGYAARIPEIEQGLPYVSKIEEFLCPHVPWPLKILDWGGAQGTNTPFKKHGLIHIYDIDDGPVLHGKKVERPEPPYGLIVCANVLEHVSQPVETLKEIAAIMEPQSILYLEVPREHQDRDYWHEHINLFTNPALNAMVDRAGLKITNWRDQDEGPYHPLMMVCRRKK
jgi:hypothetical protein